jgi:hypothetical protein
VQSEGLSLLTPYPAARKSLINKKLFNLNTSAISCPSDTGQGQLTG